MEEGPDRSAFEIKHLLLKLSPRLQHKDRVRSLQRFRNYASGESKNQAQIQNCGVTTPEFYDDDIPLLLLGSQANTVGTLYGKEEEYQQDLSEYYGLLQACSTPSRDHEGQLKRSCRNAMNLLKYLVLDRVEVQDGEPLPVSIDATTGLPELNPFAYALCSLSAKQLKIANFGAHLLDNINRGAAKDDACEILLLVLTRHFDPISDNATFTSALVKTSKPIAIEELLPDPRTKQSFENWLVTNKSRDVLNSIRSNFLHSNKGNETGSSYIKTPERKNKVDVEAESKVSPNKIFDSGIELGINILDGFKKIPKPTPEEQNAIAEAEAHAEQQLDKLGLNLYKKQDVIMTGGGNGGSGDGNEDILAPPTCWKDSQLAKLYIDDGGGGDSSKLSRQMEREKNVNHEKGKKQQMERQKMIGRDPLGIRPENFDLQKIESRINELLKQAITDLEDEIAETGGADIEDGLTGKKKRRDRRNHGYSLDQLVSLEVQRDSLRSILEREHKVAEEDRDNGETKPVAVEDLSILPTHPNFNPLLFLTLVHRDASFEQLQDSIERLNNQTDSQVQRLQSLVRDNFALFVRCADGIDLFSEKSNRSKSEGLGITAKLDKLDELAESCFEQSQKSFNPLLDNEKEVRKVNSALTVLHRVGPLLQVPSVMRQHIENLQWVK